MNHKVLLADDSLTIQKVIKITLANQPYDITDCSNEDELFHQLPIVQPKIVYLDFNLSEKFTGYELTTKIKSLLPSTKVLLLLGTFDTVDDVAMEKCGASDKIVKPFDSNKFIAISKKLIETFAEEEIPYPDKTSEAEAFTAESSDDQWTMSHSTEQKLPEISTPLDRSIPNLQNPLDKEVSDWGMSVPGIIDGTPSVHNMGTLPPVIGDKPKSVQDKKIAKPEYETKFPGSDDLDYPEMDALISEVTDVVEAVSPQASAPEEKKSKLIPIETFKDSHQPLEIEGSYVPDEADVDSIEAQIRDEVEENLWQADEFEDLKKEVASKIEEVKNNFQPSKSDFDDSLFKPLDEKESIDWDASDDLFKTEEPVSSSYSFNKNEMEDLVKKYVKEYMDEMFQQKIEKIAWEVIPDLAENLIRQELSKIATKIIEE